ncbi:hypothetical protein FEJ81_20420 (plasmid) [Natrinema versiforme]|uniref:Uncharacterized protein n=1 Tax=Natrinema versiforme TaxID=88724 RepID=A0A4P8WN99_9EURY|nr:hypothetical protein FEJ81_20420 [Natrinema versiforme]
MGPWGPTDTTYYRCTECHAGGHIADDRGNEVRQGGICPPLRNYATRRARARATTQSGTANQVALKGIATSLYGKSTPDAT